MEICFLLEWGMVPNGMGSPFLSGRKGIEKVGSGYRASGLGDS